MTSGSGEALPCPPGGGLLQASDLTYLGAFRVPPASGSEHSPAFGGTALCYWPAHDSLLMVGHDHHQLITEFSIPDAVNAPTVAELPRAVELQPYTDLLQGKLRTIDGDTSNGVKIGGITPRGSDESFVVTAWSYYDAGPAKQTLTHFHVRSWDFAALTPDDVWGPFQVGQGFEGIVEAEPEEQAIRIGGFVSGYQCVVPEAWVSDFGGKTRLTGQGGGVSILTRTSSGPSCTAYDLTPEGVVDPVPADLLMGYPSDSSDPGSDFHHPTLGVWGEDGSGLGMYNGIETFRGMVFPDDTASVLFIGWRGSSFCYGSGTADPTLHEVPIEPPQYDANGDRVIHCYDPTNNSKGTHGFEYEPCIYAYSAHDLLDVRNGVKKPWAVIPYSTFALPVPYQSRFPNAVVGTCYQLMGAAWNPAKRHLYVTGYRQDGDSPVVHVFQVA